MAAGDVPARLIPQWLRRWDDSHHEVTTDPVIDVQCGVSTFTGQAMIAFTGLPAMTSLAAQGFGDVDLSSSGTGTVTLSYTGYPPAAPPPPPPTPSPPPTPALQVNASFSPDRDAVTPRVVIPRTQSSLGTLTGDPNVRTPFSGRVGDNQVAIAWATPPLGDAVLTLSITVPLPLTETERTVLRLDGNYPGSPGPQLRRDRQRRPGRPASVVKYPVIAKVGSAATVAASGFGITGRATQLTLSEPWIDASAVRSLRCGR